MNKLSIDISFYANSVRKGYLASPYKFALSKHIFLKSYVHIHSLIP